MPIYTRRDGEEQPCWPFGPFKLRLPLIHYRIEPVEFFQAMILFVVSLAMIPLLEKYLGLPYEIALAYVFVCGIGFMMPALLGVPFVPGWITPAIPVVILYLNQFPAGPEAIRALVALQLLVAAIFIILGLTRLSSKVVKHVPLSLKSGILLGAGIAAIMGEIKAGGRLPTTPISITVGTAVCLFMLFSVSFAQIRQKYRIAAFLADYGMVPAMVVAIAVGIGTSEFAFPDVKWGITVPAFAEMVKYLPFSVGFPDTNLFIGAIPTAITAYVIAFGDVIVGTTLVRSSADEARKDEIVDTDSDRVHLVTGLRNVLHAFFAPYIGLAGPIWTAVTATVSDRYRYGRTSMDSIFSGSGTFWIAGFIALFILPLVSFFKPFLPVGLSLTMMVTGYLCIVTGFKQISSPIEIGVAGTMAVALATHGAAYGLGVGILLHILLERKVVPAAADEMEKGEPSLENV